jgi:hypothetical protein
MRMKLRCNVSPETIRRLELVRLAGQIRGGTGSYLSMGDCLDWLLRTLPVDDLYNQAIEEAIGRELAELQGVPDAGAQADGGTNLSEADILKEIEDAPVVGQKIQEKA